MEIKMKNVDANKTIELRDAVKTDVPRLLSMVRGLAIHHDDVPEISAEALERDVFGEIPWVYVVVLEVEGEVVGYAVLSPLTHFQAGVRGIDMHHLFVEKEFRGIGHGRRLIEASMQKARDLSCAYMKVGRHPENTDAQAVYLACGFNQRYGSHPRFHISLEG
jgi:GNAT superfamily N-acetyltransferase